MELRQDGQQKGYVVLTPEERTKGFVKPLRSSYIHTGLKAPEGLRDLTPEEASEHGEDCGADTFVKVDPIGGRRRKGRYWTREDVARIGKGCGMLTRMGSALSETYARDPNFYSGTFCCGCSKHFPLNEFTWEDGEPMDPLLQDEWQRTEGERRRAAAEAARQNRIAQLRSELAQLEGSGAP
jgi:hypothetical protein